MVREFSDPSGSVGELLPREQTRVRELLKVYETIPAGIYGAAVIKESLRKAEEAAISGDVVKILVAYQDLIGIE